MINPKQINEIQATADQLKLSRTMESDDLAFILESVKAVANTPSDIPGLSEAIKQYLIQATQKHRQHRQTAERERN